MEFCKRDTSVRPKIRYLPCTQKTYSAETPWKSDQTEQRLFDIKVTPTKSPNVPQIRGGFLFLANVWLRCGLNSVRTATWRTRARNIGRCLWNRAAPTGALAFTTFPLNLNTLPLFIFCLHHKKHDQSCMRSGQFRSGTELSLCNIIIIRKTEWTIKHQERHYAG